MSLGTNQHETEELVPPTDLRVETWSANEAKIAYSRNPVVQDVLHHQHPRLRAQIKRECASVLAQFVDAFPQHKRFIYRGKDQLDRITAALIRSAHGNSVDLQNPIFARRASDGRVYADRTAILEEFNTQGSVNEVSEVLQRVEADQATKVASRSLTWPWATVGPKLADGVMHYVSLPSQCKAGAYEKAKETLKRWFPERALIPLPLSKAVDRGVLDIDDLREFHADNGYSPMDTTTSSGLPYNIAGWYPNDFVKRNDKELWKLQTIVKQDIFDGAEEDRKLLANRVELPQWWNEHVRTDAKGERDEAKKSRRLVAGGFKKSAILAKTTTVPISLVMKNMTFGRSGVLPFAGMLGPKFVDVSVQNLLKFTNKTIVCGDISRMDNSKSQDVSIAIGEILAGSFRHEEVGTMMTYLLRSEYLKSGLITPHKLYLPQPATQMSGSGYTLMWNTLYLALCIIYGQHLGAWHVDAFMALGDDFVLAGEGVSPESVAEVFSHLGLEASPEKQFVEEGYVHFLQNLHVKGFYGGIASTSRTLIHMMSPERLTSKLTEENKAYVRTVRALSQLHNCEFHPRFEELVHFVQAYDRNRLFAGTDFDVIVGASQQAGAEIIREYTQEYRKGAGSIPGREWLVNWAREGKKLPQREERFPYVYGSTPESVHDGLELRMIDIQ